MITYECEQGSQVWKQARAGAITASNFAAIRDRYKEGKRKGEFKDAMRDYAFRLAIERITGKPLDDSGDYDTWQSRRGRELEASARSMHQMILGEPIRQTGIALTDDRRFGASADGLIGITGGAEYKCFLAPEKLRKIIVEDDIGDVTDQVQGSMWVTGTDWWDFVLYCPDLSVVGKDIFIKTMWRDDEYIEEMKKDLLEFDALVDQYEGILRADTAHEEPAEPTEPQADIAGLFGV